MKRFIGCAIVLAAAVLACAARAQQQERVVPLYGRFEATFSADEAFRDLSAEFTAPDGTRTVRPGYYAGGRTYKVRFMPTVEGRWTYRLRSVIPALDGRAGAFVAKRPERPATRFQKHGPVRVSASGYHLEHLDGTPFFFLCIPHCLSLFYQAL